MKTNLLKMFMAAAVSCSALVALSEEPKNNMQLASNEPNYIENKLSEISTTAVIKKKFLEDNEIKFFSINVTTINGEVTLAGTVPTQSAKDRAISLAKNTKDVLKINDNLEIAKDGILKRVVSDSAITNEIKLKYFTDANVSALDIHITTEDGNVTLVGAVPSEAIESKAIEIAEDVKSVKKVISKLEVDQSNGIKQLALDAKITTAIKLKLLKDKDVNSLDISVETINGQVTLKGIVPSESIKNIIINKAKGTDNVVKVTSMLSLGE